MGTKPCKPVVPYEEAKERLSGNELTHLERTFATVARSSGAGREATLSKDAFKAWLGTRYTPFGRVVLDRLFEVLDSDASKNINLKEFMQGSFVFMKGTREEKLRVVFNMFDLGGNNYVNKKDFKKMSLAFIVGDGKMEEVVYDEVDISYFKPMSDMMVEMGMLEYHREIESKLSFEEWCRYAEDDEDISSFIENMEHIIPPMPGAPPPEDE